MTNSFQPREIEGNYTMADAMHVPSRVVVAQRLTIEQLRVCFLQGYIPLCSGSGHFDALLTYAQCIDDSNRPFNHEGDWPVKGEWYLTRPVESHADGMPGIRIIGFEGKAPYYNSFSLERFDLQADMPFMCMN
jgi:hypothetical protein